MLMGFLAADLHMCASWFLSHEHRRTATEATRRRRRRSIHITVLFRPSQGVRSNHTSTISPRDAQGRWREEELGSSAWWQASCISTAWNWHNVNLKTFGTVCCHQD